MPSDAVNDAQPPGSPTVSEWRQAYEQALATRCESVQAQTLDAGEEATAEFSDHTLLLGLPKGERGAGVYALPQAPTDTPKNGDVAINTETGDLFVWVD